MKQAEFMSVFVGFITVHAPRWLPEEGTEEYMLDVMQKSITAHSAAIKRILRKNGNGGKKMKRLIMVGFMLVFLSGCAGLRISEYPIKVDDIKSQYADGDLDFNMRAITSWAVFRMMPKLPNNVMQVFGNQCNGEEDVPKIDG